MNTNGKRSVLFASLALPTTLVISGMISWYLKSHNPDNVDITAGLAYLRPILVSGFVTFIVMMLVSLLSGIRGLRQDTSKELSSLGIKLVIVLTVLSLAAGIASNGTSKAQDAYRDKKAQEFFRVLDQNKQ